MSRLAEGVLAELLRGARWPHWSGAAMRKVFFRIFIAVLLAAGFAASAYGDTPLSQNDAQPSPLARSSVEGATPIRAQTSDSTSNASPLDRADGTRSTKERNTTATLADSTNGPAPGIPLPINPDQWLRPEAFGSSLKMMAVMAVVSLVPAVLLMTTCFVRITIVLGLLRQAIGTPQLPSNQVLTALSLFLTLAVMTPVWKEAWQKGVAPYTNHEKTAETALNDGLQPVRRFMSAQIEATGNQADIWMFIEYTKPAVEPKTYDDVPLSTLLPAFMLSELKTAFLIGFQLYLPFLIIDVVVASVTAAMGMMMLPPVMVSLPLKLLLFVLVDGWHLVAGMLLNSFA
jgi:flagellar biosynthetic protein FliP